MRVLPLKVIAVAAASFAALAVGSASANAATPQWNPQNTVEPATLASGTTLVVTDNLGNTITCSTATGNVKAPIGGNAAVAGTVDANGNAAAPQISNCTNSFSPGSTTTVTASGQWLFTAASTTSVNASQATVSANIGGLCTISVSNASIPGNTWSNSTHQLTSNATQSVPIHESGFFCDGATSGTLKVTLQLPSTVTIS